MAMSRIQMCAGGCGCRFSQFGRCDYLRAEADEVGAPRLVCEAAGAAETIGYCRRVNKSPKRGV
jgi:hypothetical protein